MKSRLISIGILIGVLGQPLRGLTEEPTALELQQRSYFQGREYFLIRGGRVQWVLQVDRADLGPAVTGYLFDAANLPQTRKSQAYNYVPREGVRASALQVITHGGFAFTAFGPQTRCAWVNDSGIPEVEAQWWAGGIRVSERFSGMANTNAILRRIVLFGANLQGEEEVVLRLRLPQGKSTPCGQALGVEANHCVQSVRVAAEGAPHWENTNDALTIGPLGLAPGQTRQVDTYLLAQLPAVGAGDDPMPLPPLETDVALSSVRTQTRELWSRTSKIESPDTVVQELFDHSRYAAWGAVSDTGRLRAGLFQYGAEWVRDSSQFALGLVAAGHFEAARALLNHVLEAMIQTNGTTMIAGGFDHPDLEQFDQGGELALTLRWYLEWSGDRALIHQHRQKIIALVERPLASAFRDATGLIHNRREFWEQTMNDGYELIYNGYAVVALREAAAMADLLEAKDRKACWLMEANRIWQAVLTHPSRSLVADGHPIKRRNLDGTVAQTLLSLSGGPDTPCRAGLYHTINPDATLALTLALGLVPPQSPLGKRTLEEVEKLRDLRWFGGGYDRYDSSSSINNPGPWPLASCFVLRAQHEAHQWERSRATLEWLRRVEGGGSGTYYEEIPLYAREQNWLGLVAWTTGEIPYFLVRHYLGVRFAGGEMIIQPALYPNSPPLRANLRHRSGRLILDIAGAGPLRRATWNGRKLPIHPDGSLHLPAEFDSGQVQMSP